jgi:Putative esterase
MTLRHSCTKRHVAAAVFAMFLAQGAAMAGCQRAKPLQFRVTLPKARRATPADGRLLVILSKDPAREPRLQISTNISNTQQIFGMNVNGWAPDAAATLDDSAIGYPLDTLTQIPPGEYTVQAVLNFYETFHRKDGHIVTLPMDHWEGQHWSTKSGNLYSEPRKLFIDPAATGPIALALDKEIAAQPTPKDTKYEKYVRIESKLLTEFWGRKMELGAFVLLPDGFDQHPDAHYPLVINPAHFPTGIQAFSTILPDPTAKGTERTTGEYSYKFYKDWTSGKLPRMILMTIQHANQYYDDSYGVNSANIGPYGDAITQELIPYIERKFRGIGQPWARVLTGCSTGGWEALGMQVFYPDFYNGTWAGAPSPIDFRAWRLVNIYDDKNAYFYEGPWGRVPRPSIGSRGGNEVTPANRMEDDHVGITMEQDNRVELVVGDKGRGAGLWDGMQAVFGPVGPDGYPKLIWDKKTGVIDHEVAEYWRDHYDLSYIMRRDWTTIGPKLVGKIHLTVGTSDQFYLANAVRYVDAFLKSTKDPYYDGTVEYGDRFIHCYMGDPDQPESISSRTINQRLMPVMADRMLKTAPAGADVKSWRY